MATSPAKAFGIAAAAWIAAAGPVAGAEGGIARAPAAANTFVHPGLLHTGVDLAFIRGRLAAGAEPWSAGLARLRRDPASRADWRTRGPVATVARGAGDERGIGEFDADGNAAYQNALMWCLTGDPAHARKAREIVVAWAGALKEFGGRDRILAASLGGFKYLNAAELLRHTPSDWTADDTRRFERMTREALLPAIRDFAPHANGNWDTGCIKTMLAAGVFCDDPALVSRALDYAVRGRGNGCITNYIVNAAGQCQESGRDQQHAQLGLGHLADACEIAWHQGRDLYGFAGNRLLRGFEYTARYNLGEDVPFAGHTDTTGRYRARAISDEGRANLRPIYEMVWNHYEHRQGIPAPYTRRAAERIRPEGPAFKADHPGFGTLMFSRPASLKAPAAARAAPR